MACTTKLAPDLNSKGMRACEKVINTVELLDIILEYVPLTQVFVLQRINKTFRNHIHGDTRTSRRLHLVPRRTGPQEIFPCLKHITSDHWSGPVSDPEYSGASRKRLFTTDISGGGPPEHSSWEDILVTQPPITKLGVWRLKSWFGFLGYAQVETCVAGVTLGSIYKAVREVVGKHNGLKTAAVYLRGEDLIEVDFVQRWVDALPRTSAVPHGFGFK